MSTLTSVERRRVVARVLSEVGRERDAQHAKWGEQNHPDGTGVDYDLHRDMARLQCEQNHAAGHGSWLDILLEEVYEAAAGDDVTNLRTELLQVAAVAVAWVEAIDRRDES
ncbi:hypothetical protein ACJ5H2_13445 [Nocardioides sp. R1-1]|uniref:hypothetical protein n=1 Tax=Nocardioides sp. R1-1 TaxID=3383502 RepID=UPI0038CFC416